MAMWGLDIEQVGQLAAEMDKDAGIIGDITSTLTGMLGSTEWTGPDAEQFRSQWDSEYATMLRNVSEALGAGAEACRRNAAEQEQASGS